MAQQHWLHKLLMLVIVLGSLVSYADPVAASTGRATQATDTSSSSTAFVDVVVGDNHTCALRANGTVMCWGLNTEGQLGINDPLTRYSLYPVEVPGLTDATAIAAGSNLTCVIKRDQTMACWGYGYHGDSPNLYVRWAPANASSMRDVVEIAVTNLGTCAKDTRGTLMCWGYNADGGVQDFWLPIPASGAGSTFYPRIYMHSDVKTFAIRNLDRSRRVCVLRYDGRLTCMGANQNGALGLGFISNYSHEGYSVVGLGNFVEKFALHYNGGCAILTDGTVSCWGMWQNTAQNHPVPERMVEIYGSTASRFYFKGESGTIYATGDNTNGVLGIGTVVHPWNYVTAIPEIYNAVKVAGPNSGPSQHGCAVLQSGRIRCWGHNPYGQLGNGTQSGSYTPKNISLPGAPIVENITTDEDTMSGLLRIRRHPEDGDETAYMRIRTISGGKLYKADGVTRVLEGSYLPVSETTNGLRFMPNPNVFGVNVGQISVQASTQPNITGVSNTIVTGNISVTPMADPPLISDAQTYEDTQSYDGLIIQRNPLDGNEVTHVMINGFTGGQLYMPDGITPARPGQILDLSTANQGLRFSPNPNSITAGTVSVSAATSSTGSGRSDAATASITILPVVDGAPSITGVTTNEDELSRAGIVIQRNAIDGSEVGYFRIVSSAPGRFYLNDGATMVPNGSFVSAAAAASGLRFRPNPNIHGRYQVQAQAAITPNVNGLGGDVASADIVVNPIADVPRITGATVDEGNQSTSGLVVLPNINDGSEVTHFRIANIVGGILFLSDGVTSLSIGQFITVAQGAAGLQFRAPVASLSNGVVEVQAALGASAALTTAARATAHITINDMTPPDIAVPYDMVVETYEPSGTRVDFSVSATDLRDGAVAVTCDKSSGIYLPVGSHTVTCSASDRAGNSASASFVVNVQQIVPAVTLNPLDTTSGSTITLNWQLAVSTSQSYKFEVQRRALNLTDWVTVDRDITVFSHTNEASGEHSYAFRVRAYIEGGPEGPWSNIVNTTIDQTAPTVTLQINRGVDTYESAETTTSPSIRLFVTNTDDDPAVSWRWYEDGILRSDWRPIAATHDVVLTAGDGIRTVIVEVRDKVGNVSLAQETITLDRSLTNAYGVKINNDEPSTPFYTVNLQISAPHAIATPIAELQFSTTSSFAGKPWVPFTQATTYTFDEMGSNTYTIYVRFRNVNGTITQTVLDSIYVDTSPPSVNVSVKSRTRTSVVLNLNGTDRGAAGKSGIVAMQVGVGSAFKSAMWQPYRKTAIVPVAARSKKSPPIYVRYKDRAGNISTTRCILVTGKNCKVDASIVANSPPTLVVRGSYQVVQFGLVALDTRRIKASDKETAAQHLTYTVVTQPLNGQILVGGRELSAGGTFTLNDLARKRVAYRHTGDAVATDQFVLSITDAAGDSVESAVTIDINTSVSLLRNMLTHIIR